MMKKIFEHVTNVRCLLALGVIFFGFAFFGIPVEASLTPSNFISQEEDIIAKEYVFLNDISSSMTEYSKFGYANELLDTKIENALLAFSEEIPFGYDSSTPLWDMLNQYANDGRPILLKTDGYDYNSNIVLEPSDKAITIFWLTPFDSSDIDAVNHCHQIAHILLTNYSDLQLSILYLNGCVESYSSSPSF